MPGKPHYADHGRSQHDRAAVLHQRQRLLHREQETAHIDIDSLVEMFRCDCVDGQKLHESSIGEDDIHHTFFCGDGAVEPVEIVEIGDVALHSRDVVAELRYGSIERVLAAAGDEDIGAGGDQALGGG